MDVIIYNRVSTDNKDQDPESNLNKSKDFCKYNKHNIIKIILDKGVSGDSNYFDRKEGKEIDQIKEIYKQKNKPLGIVVFSIDRFTRQEPITALSIIRDLKNDNVKIFSATESIFNDDGEFSLPMQFHIVWFNHYFLTQHSKKVKAGMQKRKDEGLNIGKGILKEVLFPGTKKEKKVYYMGKELEEIHQVIKNLKKMKKTYRNIVLIMENVHDVNISIGYISKIINEK